MIFEQINKCVTGSTATLPDATGRLRNSAGGYVCDISGGLSTTLQRLCS